MIKFIIQSKKGKTSIIEVECEIIKAVEDPSVMWLNPGEYKVRILAPESFHQRFEKTVEGKKEFVLVPDIWCWYAFHDSVEQAKAESEKLIRHEFAFQERKYRIEWTEADVQAAITAIEVMSL